jgi:hypothetical protein
VLLAALVEALLRHFVPRLLLLLGSFLTSSEKCFT